MPVTRTAYEQLASEDLPLALAELHRDLDVGAAITASLPDRPEGELVDVVTGAGFVDVRVTEGRFPSVEAVRARTLPDTVGPGMRLLVCGLNPSLHAADAGVGFITPGNRFWPAALAAGLASVDRDPWHALRTHGMGMTDVAKRATRRADELEPTEYREGLARVERLCARLRPGAVCMVGLAGWRTAVDRKARPGWQERALGDRPVYVLPSTSGLNARSRLEDLVEHLRTAAGTGDAP